MSEKQITDQEKIFCQYYIINFDGTEAAKRAGYNVKKASTVAKNLLKRERILNFLDTITEAKVKRLEVSQDRVVKELGRIAFFDIRNLYDEFGGLKSLNELDDDTAAVIQSFKFYDSSLKTTVSVYDKLTALDKLARHLGLYNDKVSLGGQKDNPLKIETKEIPVDLSDLTDEELTALELLASKNATSSEESESDKT